MKLRISAATSALRHTAQPMRVEACPVSLEREKRATERLVTWSVTGPVMGVKCGQKYTWS